MPQISHRDFSCLLSMLDSIEKIQLYSSKFRNADEFFEDSLSFDGTMMNFIVIGEMVEKLSDEFISQTSKEINWTKVKSFRNIIAHNYFGIDAEEVWQIIQGSLLSLKVQLEKLI
ncbi:MAG TPA: hypothetical protein DCL77_09230 [Prolixibacteraceae bacterium]|nr:hypothetical protein [Prolixibacteraceae bacterium]